jgi:DNA-binding transcriptional ArsR family regulator
MTPALSSQADAVFRALADPTRRALLDRLSEGEASVSELTAAFDVTQSAISQHLKVLRDAELAGERKSGRQRIYHLNPEPLAAAYDWIAHYGRFWEDRLGALGQHLRKRHVQDDKV